MTNASPPLGAPETNDPPGLLVSVVLFRLAGPTLQVHVRQTTLPSAAPRWDESLDAAADRIIALLPGARANYKEQLYTFSPANAPQRNVVVSYLALQQPVGALGAADDPWVPVHAAELGSGADRAVLDYALLRLRAKLGYTNIAFHLVPEQFTLPELQRAYESILRRTMDKRNFRRRILASGILTRTDELRREGSHRPAALYRFTSRQDHTSYLTPSDNEVDAAFNEEAVR